MNIIETKKCSKCGEEKSHDCFAKQPKNIKTGLDSWCKECRRISNSERYNKYYKPKEYINKPQEPVKIGNKFGIVTVIEEPYRCQEGNDKGYLVAKCKCECGRIFTKRCSFLVNRYKPTKSCGKCQKQKYFTKIGDIFGNLTVISEPFLVNKHTRKSHSEVKLKCKCGNIISIEPKTLFRHKQKNCMKCSAKDHITHNLSNHKIYGVWKSMIDRCYNPANKGAKYYSGKGIKVCDEWKNSVTAFWEWAQKNGYSDNLTIHRVNSDGNYCPENCKWITGSENTRIAIREKVEREANLKKENIELKNINNQLKQQISYLLLLLCNKV